MTSKLDGRDDPWRKLADLRIQAELVHSNAIELEQLGLTLSGRDLATVDHAELVSYVIWISQFTSQTALVLANWGFGLVRYLEDGLTSVGATSTAWTLPPDGRRAEQPGPSARRERRWWRRS